MTESKPTVESRQRLWRLVRWGAPVAAVVVVVLGWWGWSLTHRAGTGQVMALTTVQRGPLTINVSAGGGIKNREQVILKCEVEGQTTILTLVDEGTNAKKGDLLVELDSSKLTEQMESQQIVVQNADASFVRAKANLEVARSQAESDISKAALAYQFAQEDVKVYKEGEYPKALAEAESRIALSEQKLAQAKEKLTWSEKLAGEKYLSRMELEGDRLSCEGARLDLDIAKGNRDLLKNYTFKRETAKLDSDVDQARMALDRVRGKAAADIVQSEADFKAKESELARQKDRLVKLGEQITKCRIVAPVDGMVVYATTGQGGGWGHGNTEPLDEGQQVRERQELIYLPTATSMMAEIKVHESALKKIAKGMPVRITVDAAPGKVFMGRVSKIAILPDAQSAWMNPDLKVYATEVPLDGDCSELRPGMTCQAQIVVEEYDDALFVPVQSVIRIGGQPNVYVPGARGPQARPVTLGLDNNRLVRIVDGVKAGEQVLLSPPLSASEASADQSGASNGSGALGGAAKPGAPGAPGRPGGAGGAPRPGASGPAAGAAPAPGPGPAADAAAPAGAAPDAPPAMAPPPGGGPPDMSKMTPAQMAEAGRKFMESLTPEQREEMKRKGEEMRKQFESMTPEQREEMRKRFGGGRPGGGGGPGGGGAPGGGQ